MSKPSSSVTKGFALFVFCLLAAAGLSGCRFGNYTEPPAESSYIMKAYGNAPNAFSTYVIYNDGTPTSQNTSTALAAIPASVANTFTNPVFLVTPNDTTQSPFFYSLLGYSLPTHFESSVVISDSAASDVVTLWSNPNCLTQVQYFQDGEINPSNTNTYTDSAGATKTTNGRLSLDLTVMRVIDGDCTADLQELAACYQNPTSCPSGSVSAANTLFNLWVAYGGILNLNDVARINALAYTVQFR